MNKNSCQGISEKLKARQDHRILSKKKVKEGVLSSAMALPKRREMVFKAFESRIFLKIEELKKGKGLKMIAQQMLQRLPIAVVQIKACNNSEIILCRLYILCISQKKLLKKYIIT